MAEIAEAAFQYQTALEKGDKKVVGVNVHTESIDATSWRSCGSATRSSATRSRRWPRAGPRATTPRCGAALAAHGRGRPRPTATWCRPMLDAARAEATLGEICGALREVWGDYREPARF